MSITVNDGGVLRKLGTVPVNDGGVLKSLGVITANDGGTLKKIFTSWKEPVLKWSNPSTSEVVLSGNSGTIPQCVGAYDTDRTKQTLMGSWNYTTGIKIEYDLKVTDTSYNKSVTVNFSIGGVTAGSIGTMSYSNSWHISGSFTTGTSPYFPAPLFLYLVGQTLFPPITINIKFSKA